MDLQRIVEVCEARLARAKAALSEEEQANDEYWVYPANAHVLYYQLLGDAYLKLYQEAAELENNEQQANAYADRCLHVLEEGMDLANELQIVDPIRLLLSYTYCDAIVSIKEMHRRAKIVAEKIFDLATAHTHDLSDSATLTLQHLRDRFMTFTDHDQARERGKEKGKGERRKDYEDTEEMKIVEGLFHEKKRPSKFKQIESIRGNRMAVLASPGANKRLMHVRNLRRIISLPIPVMLETINSATHILKALDRIFRAYVRGNALPGQLSGGATVDLAGNTMTFRKFVLQGPYMSWRGFLSFLLDFSIAKLPLENSQSGKRFYRSISSGIVAKGQSKNGPVALVDMAEAAMIFIESSQSATPALVLNKYMSLYAEIANTLERDPWSVVLEWAEFPSEDEWNIPYGINFMQFVDCLGKLGAVAYSSGAFVEMLPTINDKIEHFLSAQLGLSDPRKWQTRVDAKIKSSKAIISHLPESKIGQKFGKTRSEGPSPQKKRPENG